METDIRGKPWMTKHTELASTPVMIKITTRASLKMGTDMAKEFTILRMGICMKENSRIVKEMASVSILTQMAMFMWESIRMTGSKGKAHILQRSLNIDMKEILKMI
jgi:hypothetical protein